MDSFSKVPVNKVIGQRPLDESMNLIQQSSQTAEAVKVSHRLSHHEEQSAGLEMQMDLDANVLGTSWPYNSVSTASSGYDLPFFPLNQRASIPQPGRPVVRRRMPNESGQGIMNAQDWMLHDGARWQHNFESWGICDISGPPPDEAFPFSRKRNTSFHKASETGQDDHGPAGFEGLAASLSGGEWLSSLD